MKLIFNTSNINCVGIKIYEDSILKGETIVEGGIYPIYISLSNLEKKEITLELCKKEEIMCSQNLDRFGTLSNSELFGYEYSGCNFDEGMQKHAWQFAYKTVIEFSDESAENFYLDFVDVNGDGQCGIAVAKITPKSSYNKNYFLRKYNRSYLARSFGWVMCKTLFFTAVIYASMFCLIMRLGRIQVSIADSKTMAGLVGIVLLLPMMYPILRIYHLINAFRNLMTKETLLKTYQSYDEPND